MPVPVYLLFSVRLLEQVGIEFTRGRIEPGADVDGSYEFLTSIDFGEVYHDGPIPPDRREIINARHAEVVKKHSLTLEYLRHIVCRSSAERDTLLYLLSGDVRKTMGRKSHC